MPSHGAHGVCGRVPVARGDGALTRHAGESGAQLVDADPLQLLLAAGVPTHHARVGRAQPGPCHFGLGAVQVAVSLSHARGGTIRRLTVWRRYKIHTLHRIAPGCRTLCGSGQSTLARCVVSFVDLCVQARPLCARSTASRFRLCRRSLTSTTRWSGSSTTCLWYDSDTHCTMVVADFAQVIERQAENEEGTKFKIKAPFFPLGRPSSVWADPALRNTSAPMNILFNHHKLTLYYQSRRTARGLRIVGAVVQPWSIRHTTSFIDSKNPHDFPLTCWEVCAGLQTCV